MVGIVNYGMGNLHSVKNMLKYLGYDSKMVESPDEALEMDKLILPGVGNYGTAMERICSMNLDNVLRQFAICEEKPILGICLGMQLLTEFSEEGNCSGLGFVKGSTSRFKSDEGNNLKIPHMGWNYLIKENESRLLDGVESDDRFYFVHSYYVTCERSENVLAKTEYGVQFTSVIQNKNVYGVQFHPEKSHKFGMKIIKNFMEKI